MGPISSSLPPNHSLTGLGTGFGIFIDNSRWYISDEQEKCSTSVDVGFILDSSGSIRRYYRKEKEFLKKVAESFDISANGSHAGVVTFSLKAELSIKLNEYSDIESFNKAVDAIPLMGRTTRIDLALKLAHKKLFSVANGARLSTRKILILLTDGTQTKMAGAEDPDQIARQLRKSNITVIVVGMGSGINLVELKKIGRDFTYTAASFHELTSKKFIGKLREKTCEIGEPYSFLDFSMSPN